MPTSRKPVDAKIQIADAVLERFVSQHPELRQAAIVTEIPPTIRWAGIILGGVMTAAVTAGLFWLVATVSDMQVTLARLDERIANWNSTQQTRYTDLDNRVKKIEEKMDEKGRSNAAT